MSLGTESLRSRAGPKGDNDSTELVAKETELEVDKLSDDDAGSRVCELPSTNPSNGPDEGGPADMFEREKIW